MKKNQFKATTLRMILLTATLIISVVSVGGFYVTQGLLKKLAEQHNKSFDTTSSAKSNIPIGKLQSDIANNQEIIDRIDNVYMSKHDYQSKTIDDLKKYASVSNVSISDYSFEKASSKDSKTEQSSESIENKLTITITNPIKFSNLIKFIKGIETNSPKMQLTGIDISQVVGQKEMVNVKPLTIKVYTK